MAYRDVFQVTISSRVKDYLVSKCGLNPSIITEEPRSRDTVGDAVFSRLSMNQYLNKVTDIAVITSNYHASRATQIFRFVFGEDIFVNSPDSFDMGRSTSLELNEAASFESFRNTFSVVAPGNINAITERLFTHHPFCNGEKYVKANIYSLTWLIPIKHLIKCIYDST